VLDAGLCYDGIRKGGDAVRRVVCHECGKRYDYNVDDFCPKCGAYTQPAGATRIDSSGAVVRVDGIDETYHRESFVHEELHTENRKRRGTVLEQGRAGKAAPGPRPQTIIRQTLPGRDGVPAGPGKPASKKRGMNPVGWIILLIILLNFLRALADL